MYDVIIIGAGPAGCTAAKTLADSGMKVLLLEKFKLPRYKSCSGMIIKKTTELLKLYFGEAYPASDQCSPPNNHGMIFTDDVGREYRFEQAGLNVWRSTFDCWLAKKAAESGVTITDEAAVFSCSTDECEASVSFKSKNRSYTEKSLYVLNCEGAVSSLKRKLLGTNREYITTFQTFNEGEIALDPHYFYAYLQPEFSQYDAWFNVKDNQLVLGVAVKDNSKIDAYYNSFISYMKSKHGLSVSKQIRHEKWIMPHILHNFRIDYGIGRVLFAGESAGFLNPMGEGISAAMESGYCAAQAVIKNFDTPQSVITDYKSRTTELKSYMMRQWAFVGKISGTFKEFST